MLAPPSPFLTVLLRALRASGNLSPELREKVIDLALCPPELPADARRPVWMTCAGNPPFWSAQMLQACTKSKENPMVRVGRLPLEPIPIEAPKDDAAAEVRHAWMQLAQLCGARFETAKPAVSIAVDEGRPFSIRIGESVAGHELARIVALRQAFGLSLADAKAIHETAGFCLGTWTSAAGLDPEIRKAIRTPDLAFHVTPPFDPKVSLVLLDARAPVPIDSILRGLHALSDLRAFNESNIVWSDLHDWLRQTRRAPFACGPCDLSRFDARLALLRTQRYGVSVRLDPLAVGASDE